MRVFFFFLPLFPSVQVYYFGNDDDFGKKTLRSNPRHKGSSLSSWGEVPSPFFLCSFSDPNRPAKLEKALTETESAPSTHHFPPFSFFLAWGVFSFFLFSFFFSFFFFSRARYKEGRNDKDLVLTCHSAFLHFLVEKFFLSPFFFFFFSLSGAT